MPPRRRRALRDNKSTSNTSSNSNAGDSHGTTIARKVTRENATIQGSNASPQLDEQDNLIDKARIHANNIQDDSPWKDGDDILSVFVSPSVAPLIRSTPLDRQPSRPEIAPYRPMPRRTRSPLPPSSPLLPTSEDLDPRNRVNLDGNEGALRDREDLDSDPFGFFAVERKLKRDRELRKRVEERQGKLTARNSAQSSTRNSVQQQEADEDSLEYTDDDGQPAFATPPSYNSKTLEGLDDDGVTTRNPLATPHKRAVKRPSDPNSCLSSPGSSSPGSPSPSGNLLSSPHLQPKSNSRRQLQVVPEDDSRPKRGRPKKKNGTGAKAKDGNESGTDYDEVVDPLVYARELEGLLPKRRTRRKTGEKALAADDSEEEAEERTKTRRGRQGPAKNRKPSTKPRSGVGRNKSKEKADGLDDDDGEKWEQERQARIAYFKKLDQFELQKENMYIV